MLEYVEPGTEKYLSYAKKELDVLTKHRKDTKLGIMNKHMSPEPGVLIRLVSSDIANRIFIFGGDSGYAGIGSFFDPSGQLQVYLKNHFHNASSGVVKTTDYSSAGFGPVQILMDGTRITPYQGGYFSGTRFIKKDGLSNKSFLYTDARGSRLLYFTNSPSLEDSTTNKVVTITTKIDFGNGLEDKDIFDLGFDFGTYSASGDGKKICLLFLDNSGQYRYYSVIISTPDPTIEEPDPAPIGVATRISEDFYTQVQQVNTHYVGAVDGNSGSVLSTRSTVSEDIIFPVSRTLSVVGEEKVVTAVFNENEQFSSTANSTGGAIVNWTDTLVQTYVQTIDLVLPNGNKKRFTIKALDYNSTGSGVYQQDGFGVNDLSFDLSVPTDITGEVSILYSDLTIPVVIYQYTYILNTIANQRLQAPRVAFEVLVDADRTTEVWQEIGMLIGTQDVLFDLVRISEPSTVVQHHNLASYNAAAAGGITPRDDTSSVANPYTDNPYRKAPRVQPFSGGDPNYSLSFAAKDSTDWLSSYRRTFPIRKWDMLGGKLTNAKEEFIKYTVIELTKVRKIQDGFRIAAEVAGNTSLAVTYAALVARYDAAIAALSTKPPVLNTQPAPDPKALDSYVFIPNIAAVLA